MDDLISRQAALEKVRAMQTYKLFMGDDMILVDKAEVQTELMMLPPAHPEPTRIIPETRAIPSDDDRVSLSERITATYYDDEYEEWSQRTVTVRDVLDAVCDEYTVLPTAQPEPKEGEWVQIQRCTGDAQPDLECPFCKHRIGWFDMGRYCAGCGAKLKGGAG